jgi:hypothetical protein
VLRSGEFADGWRDEIRFAEAQSLNASSLTRNKSPPKTLGRRREEWSGERSEGQQ